MGPNLDLEKWLWRQGYRRIIGLDEVGRGSLAGPVTVQLLASISEVTLLQPIGYALEVQSDVTHLTAL